MCGGDDGHGKLYAVPGRRHLTFLPLILVAALAGCGDSGLSPEAQRGKNVYLSQCTSCHAADPSQPGAVGPEVKGASRQLLEAKVLKGTYPPGYTPKRRTSAMLPQPQVAGDIPALAEYLK
ncbi:MAG: cytochrome c [Candidatus Rokubacteria bacterium]|nr:cytochrome c [Candidatus Rokubacteria bacterium]